ncbi:MAG: hypothetical protein WKG07_33520 [Hymenobacter sp.]
MARTARYQQPRMPPATTQACGWCCTATGKLADELHPALCAAARGRPGRYRHCGSPSAPSRFYLTGTGASAGASWMTKADRLAEIDDQAGYLTTLPSHLRASCPPTARLTVPGFSQGTAIASRWLARRSGSVATRPTGAVGRRLSTRHRCEGGPAAPPACPWRWCAATRMNT